MTDYAIELKDVWKIFQMGEIEVPAVRGLTVQVRKHEFLSIMGPSGSGKSTALNMIGALDIPTRGTIKLDGIDIETLDESELAQVRGRKIGFIFQKFNLIDSLSAFDNVALPMMFQNISSEEKINRTTRLLTSVGLKERMKHRPNELSGGEQQRVAIARALANNPDIILADEPTGNLDSQTGKDIMNLLAQLHKRDKKTIIVITHDPNIAKYAERKLRLIDGRIA